MVEIFELINRERKRQNEGLELIASENYVSKNVLKAQGSILTNKYAEGYPGKRYYGGCEIIDEIENLAIRECCELFNVKFANVQPHSGSQANAEAYRALQKYLKIEKRKMKILSCQLSDGGHLTHGSSVSFSSNLYEFCFYKLDDTGHINMTYIEEAIVNNHPDVLLIGFSSYPYSIDFEEISKICKKHNILLMVDMAHIAGIVAAGKCQNPCKYADIVTSTTHKTLRGPRGGIIVTNNEELIKLINSAVFPYYQGGPLEHIIAAKAICFNEAKRAEFKDYIEEVLNNTEICKTAFDWLNCSVSGTENHLFLLNTKKSFGLTGLEAQNKLEEIGITTNKDMLPNDDESPKTTSGLRIGLAALTSRGINAKQVQFLAVIICNYLRGQISKEKAIVGVTSITSSLKEI